MSVCEKYWCILEILKYLPRNSVPAFFAQDEQVLEALRAKMVYVKRVRVRDEVKGYSLISLIERRWSMLRGSECGMRSKGIA